jgi:hypothetical protein
MPIDIEIEIINSLNREIRAAIDADVDLSIVTYLLCGREDWTLHRHSHPDLEEVAQWLKQYCQDEYKSLYHSVVFKSHKDAVMFLLRWL